MITPRSDPVRWLVWKCDRLGPILQLNMGVLLLIALVGADTGWYEFGGFDPGNKTTEMSVALYGATGLAIGVAIGMLARRKWAWVVEGCIVWALGLGLMAIQFYRQERISASDCVSLLGGVLVVSYCGSSLIRHGKALEERRQAGLAAHAG